MALTPKIKFESRYDENFRAINNSNLRKQRVIPDGKLVYAESNNLPSKLPSDTMLFTTDTRELYIGTGESIKRVNLGNDGEVIDKSDYLTKIEAAKIYIQKDNIPDELVTEEELEAALKTINDTIDELLKLGDDIIDIEDKYLKKEDAKKFVDKDKLDADLSKKVDIEHLTPTGNHTFVRNNDNGVSLEYQNMAGDKDSSISIGKDKIVINSSNTKGDKIGSKLYINQDGIYYTNSNDDNFENTDEILTKKDLSGLDKKINDNTLEIQDIKSNINNISSSVTEAVKTADNAAAQVGTAVTKAQTAIDTATGFADEISSLKNKVSTVESDVNTAKEKADSAKESADNTANSLNNVTNSISNINSSINKLNTAKENHETRIKTLEENSQSADITKINKAIDDVRDMAVKNKTDIADLTVRVSKNESDIATLKSKEISDIDTIREKVNSISSIETQISTLINNISTTETATNKKIDDLTSAIAQLRKDLTALNEKVDNYHKEEPIEKKNISSIDKPEIFKNGITDVAVGTPINLPTTVEVTLEDGTKKTLGISYDKTFNSTDIGSVQTITGTLILPIDGSIENPENLDLSVSFKVYDYITNIVNNSISKNVEYNTQFNDISGIPMTVSCNLASGNTSSFDIDWNEAKANYDPQNSSKQSFTGYIIEKENVKNTNNLNVALSITVASRKFDIIAINADETVHEVEFGTAYSAIGIPSSVTVTLDDNSTKTVLVNWDNSTYSSTSTLTDQTITGTLILDSNTTNSKGLTASYKVKVKEKPIVPKNIISVESISNKTVDYGTTFENLSLPSSVNVTAKNDEETSTMSLAVNWNSADYDLTKVDIDQVVTGELVLIDGVTNTNGLKASCKVKIREQILDITSVSNDSTVHEVEYDTPYSSLELPNNVTVTLEDNSTRSLSVTWSNTYSSTNTTSNQKLEGTLTLTSNITNSSNLKAEYTVKVKEQSTPEPGDEWEWKEYVKLESFANNIRKFPSKIGHDFTDEDVMGVWDEDDDTLMLEEPTVEFRYLGCMKTLTEGDKQTVTLLTEEQVHDPSIMNQNLMAVYPDGIKTPLGTGYDTEENIEAYKSKILNEFGFTSNRGLFLEDGLLRFEVAAHENNVYLVRKKKK